MKISNKKIIVSTLALAMGAALAGSISGSVAWYQYSTRAAAQILGASAGTSRNLQIKKDGGEYGQFVSFDSKNFRPVSAVANTAGTGVDHFVEHPVYQYPSLPTVTDNEVLVGTVTTVAYAEYTLYFKCEDGINGAAPAQIAKEVYLSKLEIVNRGTNSVVPAIRIAIDAANDFLVSETAGTTSTSGNLDIGGAAGTDTDAYDCKDTSGTAVTYTSGAASYTTVAPSSAVADVTNAYSFGNKTNRLMTTTKTAGDSDAVVVKVWLEGWAELGGSSLWDKKYQAQDFEIQMQFACEADKQ